MKCVISKEATSEAQLGTTAEGMDIVHELDSEGSRRPRDPHTHGGDADSEEDGTALKAELATLRKDKENLQHTVAELQKQVEQLQKLQTQKQPQASLQELHNTVTALQELWTWLSERVSRLWPTTIISFRIKFKE